MNVLVACECSGRVRDAFRALGHNAWSCDLKPSESDEGGYHMEGDVRWWLTPKMMAVWKWHLLIAHPNCQFLSVSNNGPVNNGCSLYTKEQAQQYRQEAVDFFMEMINAPVPLIAVENPIGIMSSRYRRPDQIIQPYQFGDDASKRTCLWLKGLPLLQHTKRVPGRMVNWGGGRTVERWSNQTDSGQNKLPPSPDRSAIRAVTYPGIAHAFASQWGQLG